jgi:DHA1 family bicyclomycin/chloramphenicol resistance-like MFS transporter
MGFPEFVLVIASIMGLNPMALDIMLPALPEMAKTFGVAGLNHMQMVLSLYLLGFGIGQFLVGPLSDRYGRRLIVLTGLGIYCLASALSLVAPTFEAMVLLRLLQGFGTSATRVIATSMVRDCYTGRRMASVMSLAQMVFITVPIIAPSLGQVMLVAMHQWQALFVTLFLYGLVVLTWCGLRLPETLPPEQRKSIELRKVLGYYARAITTRQTIGYALAAGSIQGGMFSFIFSAQQLLGEYYQLGRYFTLVFAFVAFGFMSGGYANSRLVGRYGMRVISHTATVFFCAVSFGLLLLAVFGTVPLWLFMVVAICTTFSFGTSFANFTALAMEPQGEIAGTAASLFGSVTILMGALGGTIVGQAYDGTVRPMAIGYFCAGLGALLLILITERGRLFQPHNRPTS